MVRHLFGVMKHVFPLVTIYNRAPYHSSDRKRNVWNLLVCVYTHPQPLGTLVIGTSDRKRNVWNLLVCVYTHPQPLGTLVIGTSDRKRNVWNLLVCVYTHPQKEMCLSH